MEKKEYVIKEATNISLPFKAYQSELNIRQAKELNKLFIEKNVLNGEFDFTVMPGELAAALLESDAVTEFINIVLRNPQGRELENKIDGDELQLNFLTEVCRDFFTFNPSRASLFGSSNVKRAMTKYSSLLEPLKNGAPEGSPDLSEKISEPEMNSNGGADLSQENENSSNLNQNTEISSIDSQEETLTNTTPQL